MNTESATNPDNDGLTAERLIETLKASGNGLCANCGVSVCHHELLMNLVMGFKSNGRCIQCLAAHLGQEKAAFRNQVTGYILRRDCYRAAWEWASEQEGFVSSEKPGCVFPKSG